LTKAKRKICRNGHDILAVGSLIESRDGYYRCRECRRINNLAKRRNIRQAEHVDPELLIRYVKTILPKFGSWERIAAKAGVRKSVYYAALDGRPVSFQALDAVVTRTGGVLYIEAPEVYPEIYTSLLKC